MRKSVPFLMNKCQHQEEQVENLTKAIGPKRAALVAQRVGLVLQSLLDISGTFFMNSFTLT